LKIGLISNSHRSLASFATHFSLEGLIHGAVSSSEHGYLKPHPSIFEAGLRLLDVDPGESVMVGDSYSHDIEGARAVGMRGVLVLRSPDEPFASAVEGVPVVRDLSELTKLL
jgi:putative hydrolase of the HAD superfamily